MRQYVNIYLHTLEFGGPEEGGWWYDLYTPINDADEPNAEASVPYSPNAKRYADEWVAKVNEGEPELSSVLSRGLYIVLVEPHKARVYPETKPHYE